MESRSFYSSSQRSHSVNRRSGQLTNRRIRRSGEAVSNLDNREPPRYYRSGDLIDAIYQRSPETDDSPYEDDIIMDNGGLEEPEVATRQDRLFELLEKQSQQLKSVLQNQTEIKAEQNALRSELECLKAAQGTSSVDEVTPKRPRKKKVTRALTDRINTIHDSLQQKLKPSESSTSPHNKAVLATLVDQVTKDPENTFPIGTVSLAVKRKYENDRRFLKESEKGEDFKCKRVKKAKYEQRKQRAYDRRKSVVTDNERQFYNMISKEYMSEESDSSDSESIVVHKHQWRSEKLNMWMEELDRRYKKKLARSGSTTPSKPRICGIPASSLPPTDAPQWAINPEWSAPSPSSPTSRGYGSSDPDIIDPDGSTISSGNDVAEFTP